MTGHDAMMARHKEAIVDLVDLRHRLHRTAELSGDERETAELIGEVLRAAGPDDLVTGLGGHGVAAVFDGDAPGPTVLLRAELDALPIPDRADLPFASVRPGISHKCGHDGHLTMLVGAARALGKRPPKRGRCIVLAQPSEEDGAGARRVLDDPAFAPLRPDRCAALHNLPGFPLGAIVLRAGSFASASTGLIVELEGATSHAAEPLVGRSPALAVAELITGLTALPQVATHFGEASKVTVVHARLGEPAFGTSPGLARVLATLRADEQPVLDRLVESARRLVAGTADKHELRSSVELTESFPATVNDASLVEAVREATTSAGHDVVEPDQPFAWSEDFGHFTAEAPGLLFGLGSGLDQPVLHHPEYDFPDALIPTGVAILTIVADALASDPR